MNTDTANRPEPNPGPETVIFGIGNSGRTDDGLGWAFLERLQQNPQFSAQAEYRYQLQVEDAAMISQARHVIFVDSFEGELEHGFQWTPCEPVRGSEFTTHVMSPGAVLALCQDLYRQTPHSEMMLIQGESWELGIGLSPAATIRLEKAIAFYKDSLRDS